ncbi:bifunctional DNA-formamidopyrimidine glycosylase/DNA-(apurinic or apyrimidinic site) lyase [Patescibacteria group bacterium]|nr:bifunctional DNA-formamidopyrimidine glycosylase/DNA-(apurinic or apyrimidinic site) lyase [Patescibacteria group bacterium]
MPELPEVETIRRDLQRKIVGKKIARIQVCKPKIIKGSKTALNKTLTGNFFTKINRRGKLLILELKKGEKFLLIHLKMTGQLIYQAQGKVTAGGHGWPQIDKLPNKYSHIIFTFVDRSQLFFNDLRQFGYMKLVDENELQEVLKKFGIEPLTKGFTWTNFQQVMAGKKTSLKAVLLNQKLIAGIGNIYADEICFRAGVRPSRAVNKLSSAELRKIFNSCNIILKQAIKYRGTTFNDYVDADGNKGNFISRLKVYQRAGKKCQRCRRSVIEKIKIAGRGTHYCPRCQE